MIKNVVKIIFIILLVICIINLFSKNIYASSWNEIKINSIGGNDDTGTAEAVQNIVAPAISVAQVIGVGVAIIMLIVLATKYMMAAPGDKADIKKHAIVYVVGAVILFSVTAILKIIKDFATKNITPSAS